MNSRIRRLSRRLCVLIACCATLIASGVNAETDPHAHHKRAMHADAAGDKAVRVQLADAVLIDQTGVERNFPDDVFAGRLVALNVMYTTCTTVCPVTSAIFSRLQGLLGDRQGSEVVLVSVSVDPVTDTPERLAAYAEKMHARDGWVWLTGSKPQVDSVLQAFGVYTADFTQHPPTMLVGDPSRGEWRRFFSLASPERLVQTLDSMAEERAR